MSDENKAEKLPAGYAIVMTPEAIANLARRLESLDRSLCFIAAWAFITTATVFVLIRRVKQLEKERTS